MEELETLSLDKRKRLLKVSTDYLDMCITAVLYSKVWVWDKEKLVDVLAQCFQVV